MQLKVLLLLKQNNILKMFLIIKDVSHIENIMVELEEQDKLQNSEKLQEDGLKSLLKLS